ncbi:TRAP transporter large permease [Falsiroseomonas tokyonensis]|uniref:TRAP transporter large permease protein n=1 Tax=Falsiroseomonas tokyonensis TaxID=430521 RepID=A0ABV7BYR8_9PROT|nr:TRAP transporter large permease [Falsiroseomonas tokyonensis]
MIAVVFLFLLLAIFFTLSMFGIGSGPEIPWTGVLLLLGVFVTFFAAGIYVGAALGVLGLLAGFAFSDRPFWTFLGQTAWGPSSSFVLVAVPLFLLMGEILLRAGLSERLYRSLNLWMDRLPGGLLHTNIVASGVFSAISGSSVATAATMGSVAMPFFQGKGYDPKMVMGSLAAGGALGNLIPPGITFIIYALITETSVGALYLAAVGPSILVMLAFIAVILVNRKGAPPPSARIPLGVKLRGLVGLVPTILLILIVLGTIYAGLATPTESAALGVVAAIGIAIVERRFSFRMLHACAEATARNTAMIGLILLGAYVLNYIITLLGIPQMAAQLVGGLPLPAWMIMALIIGFYLALGTFMEGFSMIITTIPVIFPVVVALGYDPIWFGVVVTMLVEIALISPPDGTVLYVLQGLRKDGRGIGDVFVGVLPFVGVYIAAIALLMVLPDIALWLPRVAGP